MPAGQRLPGGRFRKNMSLQLLQELLDVSLTERTNELLGWFSIFEGHYRRQRAYLVDMYET